MCMSVCVCVGVCVCVCVCVQVCASVRGILVYTSNLLIP